MVEIVNIRCLVFIVYSPYYILVERVIVEKTGKMLNSDLAATLKAHFKIIYLYKCMYIH